MLNYLSYLATLSDAKLVKYFLHGSQLAFSVLVARHNPHLKIYLHSLIHNSAKEAETLQKLWIYVMKLLREHHYREKGRFKEWINMHLFWMAKNDTRGKKRFIYEADEDIPELPDTEEEDDINDEYIRFLQEELPKMKDRDQQIVKLRFEQNMTFPEIDAVMHLKHDESRTYFSRVKHRLRKLWQAALRKP